MLSVKHFAPAASLPSPQFTSASPTSRHLFCRFLLAGRNRHVIGSRHKSRRLLPLCISVEEDNSKEMTASTSTVVWMQILEENVFRFDSSEKARKEAWPSLSFADPKRREIPLESVGNPQYYPQCVLIKEKQNVMFELPAGTSFYGTGEVSGPLERTGQQIFTWNSDAWGFGPSTTSLYQSHPWVLAVFPDGKALGLLADTTRRCEVDLRKKSIVKFAAFSPYPVITFGPFVSPAAVLRSLSRAIGTICMPPKWTLGYHQCRWSYEPDLKVLEVAKTFREKRIPCDVLWMDIDYMDGFRCFTFDVKKFPSPNELGRALHSRGFKAVWMLDPGIKAETGYEVYDSRSAQEAWILSSRGKPYVGEVWPGPCVFPDFTSEATRQWWAELVKNFVSDFVDGIWNDMNEPTVFKSVTKTMPDTNIHRGDQDIGGSQSHSHYHNVYGMLMAKSTYEGMILADSRKRPFVLTRAGYIGSQRYAATWTGDNLSTWEHLKMSVPMALNLSLSGQPIVGPDIGGFAGDATPKLFARWMGIGTLLPFCRAHSEKGTVDHEPWSFGTVCENLCRLAIERRYRLLPHIYTLFYFAHTTGDPVITPLFFADAKDPKLRDSQDSFLLGPLLVSASIDRRSGSNMKKAILPAGQWKEFDFGDSHEDLPVLYLRGGSLIPTGPVVQSTQQMDECNDLTLLVALDDAGTAEGLLYEDEGDGFEYKNGKYLLTFYKAKVENDELHIKVEWSRGHLQRPIRALNVVILLGETAKVSFSGSDGEDMIFKMPRAAETAKLVACAKNEKHAISDFLEDSMELHDPLKGVGGPREVLEINGSEWKAKMVPWIGGRMISMVHSPTGIEWLWSRMETSGYEEYSGTEYRSAGCTEVYNVIRQDIGQIGGNETVLMEADLEGGLAFNRCIFVTKESPKLLQISSTLKATSSFSGSGGFSRLARLRIHPAFQLRHPTETVIKFKSINGKNHEITATESKEFSFCGDDRPSGEWTIVDMCANVSLINRFNVEEVEQCLICWGPATCFLELWSSGRPISKASPISIHHTYETTINENDESGT